MKFDIARAWKDEAYRQSLSQEQLSTLPANPVGELSDTDLATIFGAGGGGFGGGAPVGGAPGGVGVGGVPVAPVAPVAPVTPISSISSGTLFANVHRESLAVVSCEVNVFSTAQTALAPILSLVSQTCIKG